MEPLTQEASPTCGQPTSTGTDSATSSQGSGDGPSRSGSQDGQTPAQCGAEAAPASPSPSQGSGPEPQTSGISGQFGSGSSASAGLQSSLASRLRLRSATAGSTLWRLTWKDKATPSGRPYSQQQAQERPTGETDCIGWGTPTAGDKGSYTGPIKSRLGSEARQLFGAGPSGQDAGTENEGQLNPEFVRWLMGFPAGWASSAPTGTRSSRKPPQSS
jgi:hypothetical protein